MFKLYFYHDSYVKNGQSSLLSNSQFRSADFHKPSDVNSDSIHRSIRRTKMMISDLIISNEFDLWCTFTFKGTLEARSNVALCKSKMSRWLENQRRSSSPSLQYLIVPEFHKNGALHFHALMKHYNGHLKHAINSHTSQPMYTEKGQKIYNIASYRLGFSTAIKLTAPQSITPSLEYKKPEFHTIYELAALNSQRAINREKLGHIKDFLETVFTQKHSNNTEDYQDNYLRLASYMKKYITKDMPLISGKKRYWVSKNLTRPLVSTSMLDEGYQMPIGMTPDFASEFYDTLTIFKDNF